MSDNYYNVMAPIDQFVATFVKQTGDSYELVELENTAFVPSEKPLKVGHRVKFDELDKLIRDVRIAHISGAWKFIIKK